MDQTRGANSPVGLGSETAAGPTGLGVPAPVECHRGYADVVAGIGRDIRKGTESGNLSMCPPGAATAAPRRL